MEKIYDFSEILAEYNRSPQEYINICEEAFHRELKKVADSLCLNDDRRDVLLISGPSSSGKSTSANIIRGYLFDKGIDSQSLSTDDFFYNKEEMPVHQAGFDFESPTIVNELLLLDKVNELLSRGEAYIPRYDFFSGKKVYKSKKEKLSKNGVVIVEGIHALNNSVIEMGPEIDTVRAYVSVSSKINVDGRIVSGRTLRMARRIIRDNKFRANDLDKTLTMWQSVCDGEDKYIRPYKKTADFVIDTLLPYEPLMLSGEMLELLINSGNKHNDNRRISDLLWIYTHCNGGNLDLIPKDSVLREFVSGGIYG